MLPGCFDAVIFPESPCAFSPAAALPAQALHLRRSNNRAVLPRCGEDRAAAAQGLVPQREATPGDQEARAVLRLQAGDQARPWAGARPGDRAYPWEQDQALPGAYAVGTGVTRAALLAALGAEIILLKGCVPHEESDHYHYQAQL